MARFLLVPDNAQNVDILTPSGVLFCTTSTGGGGGGAVNSVTAVGGAPLITVDNTDPTNPVVTTLASEYLGELARGNGSGGWERATNGVVAATTINPRPADANAVVELVSGTGHVHIGNDLAEVLAPTGQDLVTASPVSRHNRMQVTGASSGRADAIVAQVFNDGADHTQLGFFGGTPQSQGLIPAGTTDAVLNALLSYFQSNGFFSSVPTVTAKSNTIQVYAAVTQALPANTYTNGILGVGAQMTANANGSFPVLDGYVTLVANDPVKGRFLYQNGTVENGVYMLTTQGDGGTPWQATRLGGVDTAATIANSVVQVNLGMQSGGATYAYINQEAIVVGTSLLFWIRTDSRMGPNEGTRFYEQFTSPVAQVNAASFGPGNLEVVLSNTTVAQITASTATLNGEYVFTLGNTAAAFGGIMTGWNSVATDPGGGNVIVPGVNTFYDIEPRVVIPTLSNATKEFAVIIGHTKQRNASQKNVADGIGFLYDRTSAVGGGTNWIAFCASGGTGSAGVNTGIPVVAGQLYRLRYVHDAGSANVRFYIDGVLVATISTNVPVSTPLGFMCAAFGNVGTGTVAALGPDWLGYSVMYPQRLAA